MTCSSACLRSRRAAVLPLGDGLSYSGDRVTGAPLCGGSAVVAAQPVPQVSCFALSFSPPLWGHPPWGSWPGLRGQTRSSSVRAAPRGPGRKAGRCWGARRAARPREPAPPGWPPRGGAGAVLTQPQSSPHVGSWRDQASTEVTPARSGQGELSPRDPVSGTWDRPALPQRPAAETTVVSCRHSPEAFHPSPTCP